MSTYTKDGYILRQLHKADWQQYKGLRLTALQTDPQFFCSNYNKEVAYPDQRWQDVLQDTTRVSFGLFYNDVLIGITSIMQDGADTEKATLIASFILSAHRGHKLADLFYEARLDWARINNYKLVIVSHRAGNESSRAANQRFGFQYTHAEPTVWPDGAEADQLIYELKLT